MGYNALILIPNRHLDSIDGDPDFGRLVGEFCLSCASGLVPDRTRTEHLFSEHAAFMSHDQRPWDLFWGGYCHSSDTAVTVAFEDRARFLTPFSRDKEAGIAAAEAFAELGYRSELKKDRIVCAPPDGDGMPAGIFSERDLREGMTAISILHDGISEIGKDARFGSRLVRVVRDYTAMLQHQAAGTWPAMSLPTDIRSGNHANPSSVAGIIRPGETALVITGGNLSRVLRPTPRMTFPERAREADGMDRPDSVLRRIWERDQGTVRNLLLEIGFHVRRPDRQRAESPAFWNRENWISSPPASAPDEAPSP